MTPGGSSKRGRRLSYCLDAQLSPKVAEALQVVGYDICHVREIPAFAKDLAPNNTRRTPDDEIADWCGADGRIVVTIDNDFKGRSMRGDALRARGLEVIVFTWDLKGLPAQHRELTVRLEQWERKLGGLRPGPRIWIQHRSKKEPTLLEGKAKRRQRRGQIAGGNGAEPMARSERPRRHGDPAAAR